MPADILSRPPTATTRRPESPASNAFGLSPARVVEVGVQLEI